MRRHLMPFRAAALLALAFPALSARAQAPTRPPAPLPLEAMQFPAFTDTALANGLRLIVVTKAEHPVLSLTLAVPAGSYFDPAGKSGLAELAAGLLTKGAGSRTAEEISATIEGVGGTIAAAAGSDFLTVDAAVLAADRQLAFELLADVALRPAFAERELELLRTQTLSALALQRSQPEAIASRAFAKALYGDHPYGRRPEDASVRSITRDDLVQFHAMHVRPSQALLVVAGAVEAAEALALAEAAFGTWSGRSPTPPAPRPAPQRARTEILLVHRPGSVQSNIVVGNTTWMPNDTRGYALTVANQILGGSSDSRLFTILREQKGWTYGAYSGVTRSRQIGSFSATAEVRTEVTDSALVELMAQMRAVGAADVTPDELERQKLTLTGRFPLLTETAAQVASQVANARLLGLPNDYVQTYRQRIAGVTLEQMRAAARAGMRAEAALVVVVGDAAKLAGPLGAIAPVTLVDIEGRALAAGDLAPKATTLELDLARLASATDSFTVLVQGNPFGYQVTSLARDGDGWRYTERSAIGPIIQQQTEVRFGADAAMRTIRQTGRFQGNEMRLDVTYADGTVRGEGMTPGAQGMQPVRYAEVGAPAGTVDDNALHALLPFFRWSANAVFNVPVFASGKGVLEQRTLRVIGQESVTVPAGTFAAYRVDYSGGGAPGTYWIEVDAPHRVLKFGPAGAPLEFVRVR